ncbi:hypothetical protein LPW11_18555 [Geomonas sp. RF6]|uniref:hypothetical protein n=1 Tax=Geomonas sp. RF6 TaxID=2897342 RepID=UPI001E3624B7|nr:hypothetical protein [Geomonas sp. RF6]UFS69875.1 hypothetical protein LPW11_18555 [Geomonas sp. RF6]
MARALSFLLFLVPAVAGAADISSLARCSTAVFADISRTRTWSGKAPACCPQLSVETTASGVVVTAWGVEQGGMGWIEKGFSATMEFRELAGKKELAQATKDVLARARRLERCLESLQEVYDPLECQRKGTREYLSGEETGVEDRETLWLDDDGRACVVHYATGSSSATPTLPPTMDGDPLPPGVNLDIYLRNGGRRGR